MTLWGAIWGGILGLLLGREEWLATFVGAVLGALAGRSLRAALRKEVAALLTRPDAVPGARPVAADAGAAEMAESKSGTSGDARPQDLAAAIRQHAKAQVPSAPSLATPALAADPGLAAQALSAGAQADAATPVAHDNLALDDSATPREPSWTKRLIDAARGWLLGGNTIVRLGLLVLFVGLGFLAKYAADNQLLPPELRLTSVGLAGLALFVFGNRLRTRKPDRLPYALALQGGGVAVLYLTVFAAFRLYPFIPAGAAFALLALVCAFSSSIALVQNAMPMAFIGFAGAFAAPLLVSTGQGDHVGLFAYYLLLGVAIAAIAWLRAWRALNLLGFFATFGIASLWGVLQYRPEQLASTQPFLIGFFLVYVVASLLYATRHSLAPKQAVDATLIFGTPLVAFGLQAALVREIEYATAFSALVLGGFYLALGYWALRRARSDDGVGRWMAECFVALGLGFVTLAVPLALDSRWTSAVWAAEGAAVYWIGQRQQRWLARAAGLALQLFAALSYMSTLDQVRGANWPLANPAFLGATLLAASALALGWWARASPRSGSTPWEARFARFEVGLAPVLFWVGFLWGQFALAQEIGRQTRDAQGVLQPVLDQRMHAKLQMLAWLAGAFAVHHLALPARPRPWAICATPAWFSLPLMLLVAMQAIGTRTHGFDHAGFLVWPLALLLHLLVLRRLDPLAPQRLWSWTHSGGVWLLVLLAGNALVWVVEQAGLFRSAWAEVIVLVAATTVLLLLSRRSGFDPESALRWRWPLQTFASAYLWRAAAPTAVAVALGALAVALHSNGDARPLPYLPLLNPTDLAVALGLAASALWLQRVRDSDLDLPAPIHDRRLTLLLAGFAFVALNTVWLRIAHHYAGVPWDTGRLFDSFLVQAGYSILWTLLALVLMVAAHRRQARPLWMGGAALLGATVLKLLLIDLSNRGGSERIVVFIAVGVLMLVVGYFAPLPPRQAAAGMLSGEAGT